MSGSYQKSIYNEKVDELLPSSNEREPRDMGRNLSIYLEHCVLHDGDSLSLLDGFVRLIKADLAMTEADDSNITEAIVRTATLPDHDLLEVSTRLTRETFALAPLRFLAPYIEATYGEEEIERWYDRAVEVAATLTNDHTNDGCLLEARRPPIYKLRAFDGDPCLLSLICPLKEMQRLLGASAVNYDRDDLEYTHNRHRYIHVSNAKMGLAAIRGVIDPYYASALLHAREVRIFNQTTMEE